MAVVRNKQDIRIPPDEYQKILKSVEIKSLSLTDLDYKCRVESLNNQIKLAIEMNSTLQGQEGNDVTILFSFRLTGKAANKNVLSIKGVYELHFLSTETFSEDFHEVFKEISLKRPACHSPALNEIIPNREKDLIRFLN